MILSCAHDWVGNRAAKCVRCGHACEIDAMKGAPRCHPHFRGDTSGYLDESTPELVEEAMLRQAQRSARDLSALYRLGLPDWQ